MDLNYTILLFLLSYVLFFWKFYNEAYCVNN